MPADLSISILHLFFALQTFKRIVEKTQVICNSCRRNISKTQAGAGSGAQYRLFHDDQAEDDDIEGDMAEASRQGKGPIHLVDEA